MRAATIQRLTKPLSARRVPLTVDARRARNHLVNAATLEPCGREHAHGHEARTKFLQHVEPCASRRLEANSVQQPPFCPRARGAHRIGSCVHDVVCGGRSLPDRGYELISYRCGRSRRRRPLRIPYAWRWLGLQDAREMDRRTLCAARNTFENPARPAETGQVCPTSNAVMTILGYYNCSQEGGFSPHRVYNELLRIHEP